MRPPSPRQDLAGDSMEERLHSKASANDTEPRDGHTHGGGACDHDGAHGTEEGENDEKGLAAPVVGCLGDYGAEDDGEDGYGGGKP
jgi:hypothetical protein